MNRDHPKRPAPRKPVDAVDGGGPTRAGRWLLAAVWAACLLFPAQASAGRAAEALDPTRALSQYRTDRWQTDQGLPQNTVQALLQTRDGYLWVGTLDGLARFDGVRFTVFDSRSVLELGLGSIYGLLEDRAGTLWIGRSDGATVFREGRFQAILDKDLPANTSVWSFCQGGDDAVWVATENGLVRWQHGRARVYRQADGLPTDRLRALAFDRDGTLWIGTTGEGLVAFANGRFRTYSAASGFPHKNVLAVLADPAGGVWAAIGGGGLAHVQEGKVRTFSVADGLPTSQLSALALDANGSLWIGTWGFGLGRMREGRFSFLSATGGLSGDQIWSLLSDREGNLWSGTWVGGLNRLRNRHFQFFGAPEGLSHDNTRSVLRAHDGAMWVATAGGGVNRIQGTRVTVIGKKDGLPSEETSTLCESRDGSLWVGTFTSGLARVDHGRILSFGIDKGLPGTDVRAIYQDRNGTLWAGTMAGLARFDGRRFHTETVEGVPIERVVSILEDRSGTLWFATTRRGLLRFRDGAFRYFTTRDGLSSDKVLSLYEDERGSLWIGTSGGGLNRLRNDRFVAIGPKDGLWDPIVQTILPDAAGNLWMTCNRGFFRASRANLDAFAEGQLARVDSLGYGPADALRSSTFSGAQASSGALDARGHLWLPTHKGLVIVDPANLPGPKPPPAVRLEDIVVDGVDRSGFASVILPPGPRPLSIHYTAMTLVDADKVRFRYRMDGLSRDWVDAGNRREAFWPSLPSGKFSFRVAASVDGRNWRESNAPLLVIVQPYFWQTGWFLSLACLGALAVTATVFRLRTVQLRRRNQEMARLVKEKTEELHLANEHLSRLSFIDALTGLANRRRFDEAFEKEWRRAQRFGTPLALVMADVDAFKAYNDALGHPQGDRCLAAVAGVFLHSVGRAGDLAARYGGEEFVVLVPGAEFPAIVALAEKLRRDCEALAIPHPASPAGPVVTISLGVAACQPTEGKRMDALLTAADTALYKAKHGGRNRVA